MMRLEQHIVDTLKEWQMKLGGGDTHVRLYYPLDSLCGYLAMPMDSTMDDVIVKTEDYLRENAPYLGMPMIAESNGRVCIEIPEQGCTYVQENVPLSEFSAGFLEALKENSMQSLREYFAAFAKKHGGSVKEDVDEEDGDTVLYFDPEDIEPYVYCINDDILGITYHRFARADYERAKQSSER